MKKLGVIFAGQGNQCIGMSAKLIARYPRTLDFYQEASEIVSEPLLQYAKNGPEVRLVNNSLGKIKPIRNNTNNNFDSLHR